MLALILSLFWLMQTMQQEFPIATPTHGSIQRIVLNAPTAQGDSLSRAIDVWLPPSYNPRERYPVLYMQDGQMLFDSSITWNKKAWNADKVVATLLQEGKIRPLIIVAIWNAEQRRHSEYFPEKPFMLLSEHQRDSLLTRAMRNPQQPFFRGKVYSDAYLQFVVNKVKPYIDEHFSTQPEVSSTFIGGASMGGLISMYAVCEYPNIFGGALCLSTHWVGTRGTIKNPIPATFTTYFSEKIPSISDKLWYFDRGTESIDAEYANYQQQIDEICTKNGMSEKNVMSITWKGEDHSESSWNRRLPTALLHIFSTK